MPLDVQDALPKKAQKVYKEAYNSSWDQYKDPKDRRGNQSREATAHQVAWSAVKKEYHKNEKGEWVKD